MSIINDLIPQKDILDFVQERETRNTLGMELFPTHTTESLTFESIQQSGNPVSASVHAFDTETEIGSRRAESHEIELALIKRQIPVREKEIIALNNLRKGSGMFNEVVERIYDDVANMVDSVEVRIERMRMQLLSEGKIVIDENNLKNLVVDYGIPDSNKPVLTGTSAWSHASSDPLADLTKWKGLVQGGATRAVTSTKVLQTLLNNTKLAKAIKGTGGATPTQMELNDYLVANGLPRIVAFDDLYDVQERNGDYTTKRYYDENSFTLFGDMPLGKTVYGPTPEAIELKADPSVDVSQVGNVTATIYRKVDPVAHFTKATGTALPALRNKRALVIAKVLEA